MVPQKYRGALSQDMSCRSRSFELNLATLYIMLNIDWDLEMTTKQQVKVGNKTSLNSISVLATK